MSSQPSKHSFVIPILGALCTIGPFSIDMYLPAFQQIASQLGTTVSRVSLSLSSYFIGMAFGQVFYGPLLDRFGRRKPLYAGLIIYILASIAATWSQTVEVLIAVRAIQAIGGCAAGVACMSLVRDLFPVKEGAKVLALLILILGVSPMLAPTFGSWISVSFGWQAVFFALAAITAAVLLAVFFLLPAGRAPDSSVSLRPMPILRGFWSILHTPQFFTYAVGGAFSFGGLFAYLAGSPMIFMEVFRVTPKVYGAIFAFLSIGMIGGSQLNLLLTRRFSNEYLFQVAVTLQACVGLVFIVGAFFGAYGLVSTLVLFFLFISCVGICYPNAAALAMAPFERNAGSASALLGFLQIGVGAIASAGVGLFDAKSLLPTVAFMGVSSWVGLAIFRYGKARSVRTIAEG